MPTQLSYPGVYIEEIQSGVRTITGVATSVTAFIGRALKGPEDDPKTINNYGDFERIFGGLWKGSSLGNAIRDFYLNGGQQAVIVRLQKGATAAVIPIANFNLVAANPGSWGNNLIVILDHKTKDKTNTKLFNITIREVDPATNQAIKTEKFLNVSVEEKDPRYIPRVLEEQSSLVRVKKDGQGKWIVPGDRPGEGEIPATVNSGGDGVALDQDAFTGAGKNTSKKGLYALEKADLFNMLCLPPYLSTDNIDSDLISKAAAYCEVRAPYYWWTRPADGMTKMLLKMALQILARAARMLPYSSPGSGSPIRCQRTRWRASFPVEQWPVYLHVPTPRGAHGRPRPVWMQH